jgi:hypothetical protein
MGADSNKHLHNNNTGGLEVTITDINGNTLRKGIQARAWYNAHKGDITRIHGDDHGRSMADFEGGNTAWWFAIEERASRYTRTA